MGENNRRKLVLLLTLLTVAAFVVGAGMTPAAATAADANTEALGNHDTVELDAIVVDNESENESQAGQENESQTGQGNESQTGQENETVPGTAPGSDTTASQNSPPFLMTDQQGIFESQLFTVADIVTFSYQDGNQITTPTGTYDLDRGEAQVDTVDRGTYNIAGDAPFSTLWGDPVSNSVVGYFAMSGDGSTLDTEIHTRIPYNAFNKERFVVFSYENDTDVTISLSETGEELYNGTLDDGEYKSLSGSDLPYSSFVTVESSNPVAAQTYFDQGFYVPAENKKWSGTKFRTFVDNLGDWTNDMVVSSFNDNTEVTISDMETGEEIWNGTLDAAEAHNQPFNEATYVEVESDDVVTVGVRPFESWPDSANYAQGANVPSRSGSKIGSDFMVPALDLDYTYVFAYENNTEVTVINTKTDQVSNTYTLDAGESINIDPSAGLWRIISDKQISVQTGNRDFSADFAPVEFGESESAILEGTVYDPEGNPVEGADVQVYDASDRWQALLSPSLLVDPVTTVQSNSDGSYQTDDLGSGRYFIVADHEDHTTGISKVKVVPRSTEAVSLDVALRGELYPVTQEVEDLDAAAVSAIDENTESASEVYIEGHRTFVDPSFTDRLQPTDLHDGIDLAITTIDLSLAAANPEAAVRQELANTVVEELGWNLNDHGLHYAYAGQFATLNEEQRKELMASAESIEGEEWLQDYDYVDDEQDAIENGYTESAVYESSLNELDEVGDDYEAFEENLSVDAIDDEFAMGEAVEVLREQQDWLNGYGPADGVVITPQGNVYMVKQTQSHQADFQSAQQQAEQAEIGETVMDGVQTTGTAAVVFGDPSTKAVGAVAQGVGTVGTYTFKMFGLVAENRMAKQWSNTQVYWADDTATIPEVKNESVAWLKEEIKNPRLQDAETDVSIEIDTFLDTIDGSPIVAANKPDYPWYVPGAPQWKAVSNASVTIENTGALDTADTRIIVTDQYTNDENDNAVSEMATVYPGPGKDPLDLSNQHEVEVPFSADFSPLDPFQSHHLTVDVWTEGKLDDSSSVLYYVQPSVNLPSLSAFSMQDEQTITSKSLVRSKDYAYTTAESESDISISQTTFQDQLGNITTILDGELDPETDELTTTYQPEAGTKEVTFVMAAERGSDVNLHAYDESNRHVGFDLATGEDEIQIPDAQYTGSDLQFQRITIENPDEETIDLAARMSEFTTNSSKTVEIFAIPEPERPALLGTTPAEAQLVASPGKTDNVSFELAEIGGQQAVEGITVTAGEFENSNGVQLPGDVDVTIIQQQDTLEAGSESEFDVKVSVPETVDLPDIDQTRFTGTVTVTTANAGQVNLTLSTLVLDTESPTIELASAQETIDGVSSEATTTDELGLNESKLPLALGSPIDTYTVDVRGQGNLRLKYTDRDQPEFEVAYAVLDDGSWVELTTSPAGESVTARLAADGESLSTDVSVENVSAVVVASDYTNSDGIVDTAQLRGAIADWRDGDIDTELLRDVIEAWRSGQPVN